MTDSNRILGEGAFGPEPARDEALGALLGESIGRAPLADVNWSALSERIGARVAAHAASPWWAYASRWERRMVPLALAAGIAALVALFNIEENAANQTFVSAASVSTAVVDGTSVEDAASTFASSVTSVADVTAGIPE